MPALFPRVPAILLTLTGAVLFSAPAIAADCTYNDLHGTFTVQVDCEGLQDHSNIGNEQKRLWLGGDWGQVNIIEVPSPYKQDATQIDFIMSNLGRTYTERRSPGGVQETTVAGQEARVVLEHKMRTSSRSWVFNWQGRNLIMRAVAFGKKKERMERLDAMSAALTSTFAGAGAGATAEAAKENSEVATEEAPTEEAPTEEAATEEAATEEAPTEEAATEEAATEEAVTEEAATEEAATEEAQTEEAATEGEAPTQGQGE